MAYIWTNLQISSNLGSNKMNKSEMYKILMYNKYSAILYVTLSINN